MTPITALRHHAETRPESTAFVMGKDVWSYARFAVEVDRLARGLIARGLRRGDRVALHLFNGPELAVAYHACFRIGAIAAPLNTRLKSAELDPLLRRLRPALYIGQANLYAKVAGVDPMKSARQCALPCRWRRHGSSRAALDHAFHRHHRRILARPGGYRRARLAVDDIRHHGRAQIRLPYPRDNGQDRGGEPALGLRERSYRPLRRAHGSFQRRLHLPVGDPSGHAPGPGPAIRCGGRARCDCPASLQPAGRDALQPCGSVGSPTGPPAAGRLPAALPDGRGRLPAMAAGELPLSFRDAAALHLGRHGDASARSPTACSQARCIASWRARKAG